MTADKRALAISVFVGMLAIAALQGYRLESMGPEVGRIEGSIVDDALESIAGVPVVLAVKGRTVSQTRTDKEGTFRFNRITLGTYELSAARTGHAAVRKIVPLKRAGAIVQLGLAMPRDGMGYDTPPPQPANVNRPVAARPPQPPVAPSSSFPRASRPQPGSIYGLVTDVSGGPLPGVTVTVAGPALNAPRSTVASETGAYQVTALPAGTFGVTFELAGFKKVTRANVAVRRESSVRLDMKFEVGALSEEITVAAAAPIVDTKKTTSGATTSSLQSRGSGSGAQWNLADHRAHGETARYAHIEQNRFKLTSVDPLSTFGADVDTASFANVRRFLNEGRLPPVDAVRVEEFVNYFKFDYEAPATDRAVSITSEVGECPWAPGHKLVLVGARTRSAAEAEAPRNLVFLIDVSGSMQPPERLPLLKTALAMFVDTLRPTDELSIVTYAGYSGVALRPTPARHRDRILDAIAGLGAGGSTNGAAGLMLAYRLAREQFVPGGVNRIILATDGDFNVGITGKGDLFQLIDREKRSGVFLSVLGVGTNNLMDETMEMLADKGNGHYSYLDSLQEARRVLIREGNSTLETVAKDVKFQVEFNPATVQAWKLIGYENRVMAHEAFNDDRKDGGELGAGHTVTVLYEVIPAGAKLPSALEPAGRPAIEPLVYQERRTVANGARRDDLLTVRVRYKQPDESESVMFTSVVRPSARGSNMPFAAAVAEFGLLLREEEPGERRWDALLSRVQSLPVQADASGDRSGFVRMVELAAGLRRIR